MREGEWGGRVVREGGIKRVVREGGERGRMRKEGECKEREG